MLRNSLLYSEFWPGNSFEAIQKICTLQIVNFGPSPHLRVWSKGTFLMFPYVGKYIEKFPNYGWKSLQFIYFSMKSLLTDDEEPGKGY